MPGGSFEASAVTLSTVVFCVEVNPLVWSTESQSAPSFVLTEAWKGTGVLLLTKIRKGCTGGGGAADSPRKNRPWGVGSGTGGSSALATCNTGRNEMGPLRAAGSELQIR